MPSYRGGMNIEKYFTSTERSDWSVLRAYVINVYIFVYVWRYIISSAGTHYVKEAELGHSNFWLAAYGNWAEINI